MPGLRKGLFEFQNRRKILSSETLACMFFGNFRKKCLRDVDLV